MTKEDTTGAAVLVLLLLAGGGAAFAATRKPSGVVIPGKPTVTPSAAPPDPKADGAALMKRANQKAAAGWASLFADSFASPLASAGLARWAGIESSGNPTAKSRLNERGLLQAGAQTVAEGGLTAEEFDALINPATSKQRHAAIAVKYADWLAQRASRHLAHPPADPVDLLWYAKLYHQRPVDVRDGQLSGVALDDARRLATAWANDAKAMHRLRAANVVAWGTATP
jgi:hypothetical protein